MKIIKFILIAILFLALFFISYLNTQIVDFNLPLDKTYQFPLIVLLLITFIVGVFLGLLTFLFRVLSLRRKVTKLNRELKIETDRVLKLSAEPTTVVIKENVVAVE